MQRIMIVGCSGSGKSTLSRKLGKALDLPVIHLDQHYFNPGWQPKADKEWEAIVADFARGERWLIDGNYSRTFQYRTPHADKIIFIDFPTWLCLWRVFKRTIFGLGRVRPDSAPGCPERFDLEFIQFVLGYRRRSRPKAMKLKEEYPDKFLCLKSPKEVAAFLSTIENQTQNGA